MQYYLGSIASIISVKLRSSEGFNVIINTVFSFFVAFASTAFYPGSGCTTTISNHILSKSIIVFGRYHTSWNFWSSYGFRNY